MRCMGTFPKNTYCGINKVEFAVYDSVAVFNYGRQASLDIYKMVNVKPGQYTTTACHSMNISRKYNASYKTMETSKRRRKVICGGKKKKDDTHTERRKII